MEQVHVDEYDAIDAAYARFRDRTLDALVAHQLLRDSLAITGFASLKRWLTETTAVYCCFILPGPSGVPAS